MTAHDTTFVPTLDEMAELEAKATPGPWRAGSEETYNVFALARDSEHIGLEWVVAQTNRNFPSSVPDALFLAAARSFVPWAITEIRELRRFNDALVAQRNAANERTFQAAHERDIALARIRELETELAALKGGDR